MPMRDMNGGGGDTQGHRTRDWTPNRLDADVWLDGGAPETHFQDTGATTRSANGDPVGLVKDKAGKGHDTTQGTTSEKPTATDHSRRGRRTIDGDGSDDVLLCPYSIGLNNVLDVTVVMAGDLLDGGSANVGLYGVDDGLQRLLQANDEDVDGDIDIRTHDGDSAVSIAGVTPSGAHLHVHRMRYDVTNGSSYRMDRADTRTWTDQTDTSHLSDTRIFRQGDFANNAEMRLFEWVAFGRHLTDAETQRAENYIARRWGLN